LAFPVWVYLVDKKARAPRSPKAQPPHAPTDVQEGSPYGTFSPGLFRNALLLAFFFFKKRTKATCSADHGAPSAIFSLLQLLTAKG